MTDKKFVLKIWRYHSLHEETSFDTIDELKEYWKENWLDSWGRGSCSEEILENNKEIKFDKLHKLGFYNYEDEEDDN